MFFFDPKYFLFAIPGILFAMWAQYKVKSTFQKYAQVPTSSLGYGGRGITGEEVAQMLMQQTGVRVGVNRVPGELTDHYDPRTDTIYLSDSSVQNSVASVAVVAHEFGHAMQDAKLYAPLRWRGAIVGAVQVGSWIGPMIFMAGMMFQSTTLAWVGLLAFGLTTLFSLITLPVEFDASRRAMAMLKTGNILNETELKGAKKVLDAAALTYLAAAAQSILTLIYYVSIAGGLNRRNSDE